MYDEIKLLPSPMTYLTIFTKNMNYNDFETIGLNENEAKIYLAILNLGESLVSRIADKAEVKRTTAYLSLYTLKKKGLIGQAKKNNQMHYFAEDPKVLEKIMQKNNEKFSKLISEITSIIKLTDHRPCVQYFDDNKNYKRVYEDILNYKNQEVLSWHSGNTTADKNKYFLDHFNTERLAKKISFKTIFSGLQLELKNFTGFQKTNQLKFIPKEASIGNGEVYIYGKNKIGMISGEDNISVIIESEGIYKMLKGFFNLLWLKI